MHTNYYFLKLLAQELDRALVGEKLLTCFSQEKDVLMLGFSNDFYLKCTLKPDFSGLTYREGFSRARKNSVDLWELLLDNTIKEIRVYLNERAICFNFTNDYTLVLKFFANRPNALVYHGEKQIAMFNNKLLGDKEIQLAGLDREIDFSFEQFEKLEGNYRKQFFTFGKEAFAVLEKKLEGVFSLKQQYDTIFDFENYLQNPNLFIEDRNGLPVLTFWGENQISDAISASSQFIDGYLSISGVVKLKNSLIQKLNREIGKTQNYFTNTESKLQKLKNGIKNEEIGHIIMANLHRIKGGETQVELLNFYTDNPVVIKLKKDLSPQKNAEDYYRKAKNEEIELETLTENLNLAKSRLDEFKNSLLEVEKSEDFRDLRNLSKEISSKEVSSNKDSFPFKEFVFKNIRIWVGRNAKNNDLLLTQYTHKDEWWLHAKDVSGSHVVIKSTKPSAEVLEYAASLAAFYSKKKSEKFVPVIYTQKKFVRKAKRLAAGQVIVEKEKTLLVEPYDGR